jgi:hypothetical protein
MQWPKSRVFRDLPKSGIVHRFVEALDRPGPLPRRVSAREPAFVSFD